MDNIMFQTPLNGAGMHTKQSLEQLLGEVRKFQTPLNGAGMHTSPITNEQRKAIARFKPL